MAELREKAHHILLVVDGKNTTLELFDSLQWDKGECDEGLYRVRVDGKWHCPLGKYTFLSPTKIGELCGAMLTSNSLKHEPVPAPPLPVGMEVKVFCGAIENGTPCDIRRGIVMADPQLSPIDGRWYVEVRISGIGWRFVLADNVTPMRG